MLREQRAWVLCFVPNGRWGVRTEVLGERRLCDLRAAKCTGSGGVAIFAGCFSVRGGALWETGLRHGYDMCAWCGREGWGKGNDAALPRRGKGRCRCADSTLFAPAGQKRFRVGAPDFGRVAGERWIEKRSTFQERSGRRAGRRKAYSNSCRPRSQTAAGGKPPRVDSPPSPHPNRSPPAYRADVRQPQANGAGRRPCDPTAKSSAPSLPQRPVSPAVPRGDRRALPAPAQGIHPLRIPFWGTAAVSPQPPVPQNAEGGRPLLVGLPPSTLYTAPSGTKRRTPAPCSWGGRSSTSSQRLLAVGTADYSRILVTTPEPTVRPPSRIAKRRPSSHAIGVIKVISMSMLSPGITISTPSGSLMLPVTSVVRK